MKEENQHIDKLFRDGLSGFEVSPPQEIRGKIMNGLEKANRKKRIVFLMRVAAIVLIILGTGFVANYFMMNETLPENQITRQESVANINDVQTAGIEKNTLVSPEEIRENNQAKPTGKQKAIAANNDTQASVSKPKTSNVSADKKIVSEILQPQKSSSEREATKDRKETASTVDRESLSAVLTNLHTVNTIRTLEINNTGLASVSLSDIAVPSERNISQRWSVGGQATPLYAYRELYPTSKTSLTQEYFNNVETPIISYSGGVNLSFKASRRLSVQSGVYYARLGQHLNNVYLYQRDELNMGETYQKAGTRMVPVANSHGPIVSTSNAAGAEENLLGNRNVALFNNALDLSSSPDAENILVTQNFDYLEIPLTVRYKVIDKRLGVNLISGLSTNWLIGNSVMINAGGDKEQIGETNGIKNLNYSGLLGIGFDYRLFSRVKMNMEPTFKYFLDPVNPENAINTHPYSFGIYTGFTYSF